MTTALVLSDRDADVIRRTLYAVQHGRVNIPSRPSAELNWSRGEDHQAPEVYIGKSTAGTGTGDGDDIPAASDTTPGEGVCDIYKILIVDDAPVITQITGRTKVVYNISANVIAGDQWIVLKRTKAGKWLASQGCC